MYSILKEMYKSVQSCVKCPNGYSDYFECPRGLKQGCVLSPFLLSLMVQEITFEVLDHGKRGIQLHPDMKQLFIILFADDVALKMILLLAFKIS